jgi:hypothetical protein
MGTRRQIRISLRSSLGINRRKSSSSNSGLNTCSISEVGHLGRKNKMIRGSLGFRRRRRVDKFVDKGFSTKQYLSEIT